jgi:hypothetical protein
MYNGHQTENVIVKLVQHARSKPVEISSRVVCIIQLKSGSENSSAN